MNKKFYEIIYDCIVTGQVSPDRIAKYFEDKGFYKYWKKKQNEGVYGHKKAKRRRTVARVVDIYIAKQGQEELNASYKQFLANKKERDKN